MEFYARHGFAKDASFHEPDDHIAVECAFMSVLCSHFVETVRREGIEAAPCQKQLGVQLQFLTEHLMKWIPDWANEVQDFAETDFYRALAGLTKTWVEADQRFLAGLLRTHRNSA
jgi:TorA maturation chaperone TorD